MTKIFTDSEGNKYEVVGALDFSHNKSQGFMIEPLEAEKKEIHRWVIKISDDFNPNRDNLYGEILGDITEPTAELISEAIKSLIEYIQGDITGDLNKNARFIEARKAYQEDRS